MKLGIGCDEAAFELKEFLKAFLLAGDEPAHEVRDFGVQAGEQVDYPDIAEPLAVAVASGALERGILLCGTGLGMAIAANKVPGIRAATCGDVYSAERAQKSNAAQILTLGARVVGVELAKVIVTAWLESSFAGRGSTRKVAKIMAIEARNRRHGECAEG